MSDEREEFLRRRLAAFEHAWNAGNVPALLDAVELCGRFQHPLPAWAVAGVTKKLREAFAIPPEGKRGSTPSDLARYRMDQVHYERWSMVNELRDRKDELVDAGLEPTLEAAFENASKALAHTPAAGAPATIRASYWMVESDFKKGVGGKYFVASSIEDKPKKP